MDAGTPAKLDSKLTALRMLVTTLIVGQFVIAAILIFSVTRMNGPLVPGPRLSYVFLGLGLAAIVANAVALPVVVRSMRAARCTETGSDDELLPAYQSETLIRAALLEAPAVILLLGFVLTADWLVLAPVPVLLAWLVTLLPSRPKFDAWLGEVRRSV